MDGLLWKGHGLRRRMKEGKNASVQIRQRKFFVSVVVVIWSPVKWRERHANRAKRRHGQTQRRIWNGTGKFLNTMRGKTRPVVAATVAFNSALLFHKNAQALIQSDGTLHESPVTGDGSVLPLPFEAFQLHLQSKQTTNEPRPGDLHDEPPSACRARELTGPKTTK